MTEMADSPSYTERQAAKIDLADGDTARLTEEDTEVFRDLLRHDHPDARKAALDGIDNCLRALHYEPVPAVVEPLIPTVESLLTDDNPGVRAAAGQTLGRFAEWHPDRLNTDGIRQLVSMVEGDEAERARSTAARTLGYVGTNKPDLLPSETVQVLINALNDGHWRVECAAVESLADIGAAVPDRLHGTDAVDRLLARDDFGSVNDRLGQVDSSLLYDADALERLSAATTGDSHRQRSNAVAAIGDVAEAAPELLTDDVVVAVLDATDDENEMVRWKAAIVLGEIGEADAARISTELIDTLRSMAKDDNVAACREWAVAALETLVETAPDRVATETDVKALFEQVRALLTDRSSDVQKKAASALSQLGTEFPEHVDTATLDELFTVDSEQISGMSEQEMALSTVGVLGREQPHVVEARHVETVLAAEHVPAKAGTLTIHRFAEGDAGPLASSDHLTRLADYLHHDDSTVRFHAGLAFVELAESHPNALLRSGVDETLREAITDPDTRESSAVRAFGILGVTLTRRADETVTVLEPLLDDTSVQLNAAAALLELDGDIPTDAARQTLRDEITSGYRHARHRTIKSVTDIAETHPDRVEPLTDAVVEALSSHFSEVREAACEALERLGVESSLSEIRPLTNDDSEDVRQAAAAAVSVLTADANEPSNAKDTTPDEGIETATSDPTAAMNDRPSGEPTTKKATHTGSDDHIPTVETDSLGHAFDFAYEGLVADPIERFGGAAADIVVARVENHPDELVAVKTPRSSGTLSKAVFERFEKEARSWSRLDDHPHIVGVYDWGTRPKPWLALEYMDGGTLDERRGTVDVGEALWIAVAISSAVWYGHRHSTHHRDIKPQNILFSSTDGDTWDVPKIADWGSARRFEERTSPTDGYTPEYAAPEQLRPEAFEIVDERTDVFQLGVVCYELLTGQHPFVDNASPGAAMMAILSDDPEPPTEANGHLPEAVDDILRTALAKQPADRYETVLDLRRAFESVFEAAHRDTENVDTTAARTDETLPTDPHETDSTDSETIHFVGYDQYQDHIAELYGELRKPNKELFAAFFKLSQTDYETLSKETVDSAVTVLERLSEMDDELLALHSGTLSHSKSRGEIRQLRADIREIHHVLHDLKTAVKSDGIAATSDLCDAIATERATLEEHLE